MGESAETRSDAADRPFGRRALLRLALGAVGAAGIVAALLRGPLIGRPAAIASATVTVSPACAGCTGCVAVCPVDAIEVAPGGIIIIDERCLRCGYCQAACPEDALSVNPLGPLR